MVSCVIVVSISRDSIMALFSNAFEIFSSHVKCSDSNLWKYENLEKFEICIKVGTPKTKTFSICIYIFFQFIWTLVTLSDLWSFLSSFWKGRVIEITRRGCCSVNAQYRTGHINSHLKPRYARSGQLWHSWGFRIYFTQKYLNC